MVCTAISTASGFHVESDGNAADCAHGIQGSGLVPVAMPTLHPRREPMGAARPMPLAPPLIRVLPSVEFRHRATRCQKLWKTLISSRPVLTSRSLSALARSWCLPAECTSGCAGLRGSAPRPRPGCRFRRKRDVAEARHPGARRSRLDSAALDDLVHTAIARHRRQHHTRATTRSGPRVIGGPGDFWQRDLQGSAASRRVKIARLERRPLHRLDCAASIAASVGLRSRLADDSTTSQSPFQQAPELRAHRQWWTVIAARMSLASRSMAFCGDQSGTCRVSGAPVRHRGFA